MDLSVDRAVESGLISEGDDILDLWFQSKIKRRRLGDISVYVGRLLHANVT